MGKSPERKKYKLRRSNETSGSPEKEIKAEEEENVCEEVTSLIKNDGEKGELNKPKDKTKIIINLQSKIDKITKSIETIKCKKTQKTALATENDSDLTDSDVKTDPTCPFCFKLLLNSER